jgi:predicted phosphoadenosine phosphosulfate sulfurtransferase
MVKSAMNIETLENQLFFVDAVAKTHAVMEKYQDKTVRVAYSGGADSDSVLWLLRYCGYDVQGVFYDTGIEYDATHRHIEYMRSQGFVIDRIKAKRPIPTSQRVHGSAFISKNILDVKVLCGGGLITTTVCLIILLTIVS